MAMIHVNRGATSLGVFSEEQIREGLRTGRFAASDIGWREGMANWQPLSQFAEFVSVASDAPPLQTGATVPAEAAAAQRSGLPWEHRQERGFFNALVETLMLLLTTPSDAVMIITREAGVGEPLSCALIGGCVGAVVSFLFSLGLHSIGLFSDRQNALVAMAGMGIGSVAFIILLPLLVIIGLFIGSAIVHLCLMIVGGANQPFETTFRVLAFSQGSTGPLQMIPICGGVLSCVWGAVFFRLRFGARPC